MAEATAGDGCWWRPIGGTRLILSGCWAPKPRRQAPGRRRDWQAAQAALERLGGWSRHRDHREPPHLDRAGRDRPGHRVDRAGGYQERDSR